MTVQTLSLNGWAHKFSNLSENEEKVYGWKITGTNALTSSCMRPAIALSLASAALGLTTLVAKKYTFAPLSFGPSAFIASFALTALFEGVFGATHYFINQEDGSVKDAYTSFYKRFSVRFAAVALAGVAATVAATALMNMNQVASLVRSVPLADRLSQAVSFSIPSYTRALAVSAANVASFGSIIFGYTLLEKKLNETQPVHNS